jgi:hypothetical protein
VSVLDFVFVISIITAVITSPFLLLQWPRGTAVFVVAVILGLLIGSTTTLIGRLEVLHYLDGVSANERISVDGRQVQNSEEVINTLKNLTDLPAHHSSPTKRIAVEISDQSHLVLWLGRDSNNPREYWVFYPRHFITRSNEIGRVITPLFDAY